MKYAFIDVEEDEEGCTFDSKKEVMEYIEEWNEDMETDYKSIEDFNKGELYYKLIRKGGTK